MSDTIEDPTERLKYLRARQQEMMAELVEANMAIDATMAELRGDGRSVAQVAGIAGLSRQETYRRLNRHDP